MFLNWFFFLLKASFSSHDSCRVVPDTEGYLLVELLQMRVYRTKVKHCKQAQYAEEAIAEVHRLISPKDQPEDECLDKDEERADV